MLYRIYTEDKNHEELERLISKYFEGFTIVKGEGFWRLQKENSLIIEIVTEDQDNYITKLASEIKKINQQEAVLIQKLQNCQWLV